MTRLMTMTRGDCDPGRAVPADPDYPQVPEVLEAGFTHRYGGTGTCFSAGGPLDGMLPGPGLAWHIGHARRLGLGALSDDELIGVLCAARRLCSWQAQLELAVVAELDARRAPQGRWPRQAVWAPGFGPHSGVTPGDETVLVVSGYCDRTVMVCPLWT